MAISRYLSATRASQGIRRTPRLKRKHRVFFAINGIITSCIAFEAITNPYASAWTAVYVALLSLVCTLPLLFATSYRGRASLLIVFLSYYFATFGLSDLVQLFSYHPDSTSAGAAMSWGGSIAVLLGAVFFLYWVRSHYRAPSLSCSGLVCARMVPQSHGIHWARLLGNRVAHHRGHSVRWGGSGLRSAHQSDDRRVPRVRQLFAARRVTPN